MPSSCARRGAKDRLNTSKLVHMLQGCIMNRFGCWSRTSKCSQRLEMACSKLIWRALPSLTKSAGANCRYLSTEGQPIRRRPSNRSNADSVNTGIRSREGRAGEANRAPYRGQERAGRDMGTSRVLVEGLLASTTPEDIRRLIADVRQDKKELYDSSMPACRLLIPPAEMYLQSKYCQMPIYDRLDLAL